MALESRHLRPRAGLAALLPLLLLTNPTATAIDLETRVVGLEARLEALTRRVQAMESVLKEGGGQMSAAALPNGEPVWALDDYVGSTPLRVLQHSLDRDTGRLDLLLDVVAELPDAALWQALERGAPVPLTVGLSPAPPGQAESLRLVLERAASVAPGSRIHLSGMVPPKQARLVRKIAVNHAPIDAGEAP